MKEGLEKEYCKKCGAELPEGQEKCATCGEIVSDVDSTENPNVEQDNNTTLNESGIAIATDKTKNKKVIIIVAAVVFAVLLSAGSIIGLKATSFGGEYEGKIGTFNFKKDYVIINFTSGSTFTCSYIKDKDTLYIDDNGDTMVYKLHKNVLYSTSSYFRGVRDDLCGIYFLRDESGKGDTSSRTYIFGGNEYGINKSAGGSVLDEGTFKRQGDVVILTSYYSGKEAYLVMDEEGGFYDVTYVKK